MRGDVEAGLESAAHVEGCIDHDLVLTDPAESGLSVECRGGSTHQGGFRIVCEKGGNDDGVARWCAESIEGDSEGSAVQRTGSEDCRG